MPHCNCSWLRNAGQRHLCHMSPFACVESQTKTSCGYCSLVVYTRRAETECCGLVSAIYLQRVKSVFCPNKYKIIIVSHQSSLPAEHEQEGFDEVTRLLFPLGHDVAALLSDVGHHLLPLVLELVHLVLQTKLLLRQEGNVQLLG